LPDVFGKIKASFDEFKTAKPDEVLAKKFEQREKEFATLSEQYQRVQQDYDGYKSQVQADKINTAKKLIQQTAYNGINWKTNATTLEKKGFRSEIEDQYDIEVADDGSHFAVYRIGDKKGSRVSNPSVANKFMTFDELVMHEATKEKLIADPREGNSTRSTHQQQQRQTQGNQFVDGQRPVKRLNPKAGIGG
jgi:prenyltransferase beta subunit